MLICRTILADWDKISSEFRFSQRSEVAYGGYRFHGASLVGSERIASREMDLF